MMEPMILGMELGGELGLNVSFSFLYLSVSTESFKMDLPT